MLPAPWKCSLQQTTVHSLQQLRGERNSFRIMSSSLHPWMGVKASISGVRTKNFWTTKAQNSQFSQVSRWNCWNSPAISTPPEIFTKMVSMIEIGSFKSFLLKARVECSDYLLTSDSCWPQQDWSLFRLLEVTRLILGLHNERSIHAYNHKRIRTLWTS